MIAAVLYIVVGVISVSLAYENEQKKGALWTYQLWWSLKVIVFIMMVLAWPLVWLLALLRLMLGV